MSFVGRYSYTWQNTETSPQGPVWGITVLLPCQKRVYDIHLFDDVEVEEISKAEYFLELLKYENGRVG